VSWPADGLPRFVVADVEGLLSQSWGQKKSGGPEHLSAHVLDRAFCHRSVATFRSEHTKPNSLAGKVALARALAHAKCAELNATDKAAA
jgi:hypothetical protein